jgi:hypothetical protein
MFNKYQMVLLGMMVAQGANLVASEHNSQNKALSNSGKIKAAAAMMALEQKQQKPLGCSQEFSPVCCGSGKVPYHGIPHSIIPFYDEGSYSNYFPGAKYNPANFK